MNNETYEVTTVLSTLPAFDLTRRLRDGESPLARAYYKWAFDYLTITVSITINGK
jgi:hypothetical protein